MRAGFIERTLASLLAASAICRRRAEQLAASGRRAAERRSARQSRRACSRSSWWSPRLANCASSACLFAFALMLALLSRIGSGRGWRPGSGSPCSSSPEPSRCPPSSSRLAAPVAAIGRLSSSPCRDCAAQRFYLSRAETAATLSALLVLTTPWPWVLKALRTFRCPMVLVAILGMTYRYIFVILQTAFEMFESRKSRTVGVLEPRRAPAAGGLRRRRAAQ